MQAPAASCQPASLIPEIFLSPPVFNLGGGGLAEITRQPGVHCDPDAFALRAMFDIGRAADEISEFRGYFLPWTSRQGGVTVEVKVPLLARLFGKRPAWTEIMTRHEGGTIFALRQDNNGDQQPVKVTARRLALGNHLLDVRGIVQTTEVTLDETKRVAGGTAKFEVAGVNNLLAALVSAGIIAASDMVPIRGYKDETVPDAWELHSAVAPLANFLFAGAGEDKWVLRNAESGTRQLLRVNGGRLAVPDTREMSRQTFFVETADGRTGVQYYFHYNPPSGDPLPYPVEDDYELMVWEQNPLNGGTFPPFSEAIGRIARASAERVFRDRKIEFRD